MHVCFLYTTLDECRIGYMYLHLVVERPVSNVCAPSTCAGTLLPDPPTTPACGRVCNVILPVTSKQKFLAGQAIGSCKCFTKRDFYGRCLASHLDPKASSPVALGRDLRWGTLVRWQNVRSGLPRSEQLRAGALHPPACGRVCFPAPGHAEVSTYV